MSRTDASAQDSSVPSQLTTARRAVIQTCFRRPPTLSADDLARWHEKYSAAEAHSLYADDDVIREVVADSLDSASIEEALVELAAGIHVENGFCHDCRHLFDNWPDMSDPDAVCPSTGQRWPGSGADWEHRVAQACHTLVLEAAMRGGCRFCAFRVQMMRDAGDLDTVRKIEARLQYLGDDGATSLSVQNWGQNDSQLLWMNFPGKICDHCNSGIAASSKFQSGAFKDTAETYLQQRDVLDVAKDWLESCLAHEHCCNTRDRGTLPTRLVSITNDVPRLVLTAGWEHKPRYSTLSYCWGTADFVKLTTETHDSFLEGLALTELPKTIQDAIFVSRTLGLDYVWIDSLCIVQGDEDDWRREAGLMSDVFGGSFVNIAASSATSVHGGLFLKPPGLVDGLRTRITIKGASLVRDFASSSVYENATTGSHLATRGWAFQEKLLPCRTIHFGNRGAFWECKAMIANEFLPDGFSPLQQGHMRRDRQAEHLDYWWLEIVRHYSAANLTFAKDKLAAISGVARDSAKGRGDTYLAGMWRDEDMEAQLCWKAEDPQPRPPWRAPSWAWAAVDGEISYFWRYEGVLETMFAHLVDAKMTLVGNDPFGQVQAGCLRLACSAMLAAELVSRDTVKISLNGTVRAVPIFPDCTEQDWKTGSNSVYLVPLLGGQTGHAVSVHQEHNEEPEAYTYEMLVCGIVLKATVGASGQFSRIGMFQFWKDRLEERGAQKQEELYEPFLEALREEGNATAKGVCEDMLEENIDHPDERYIISIV